eukprot:CAMPEP_0113582650 /NCGR_PEP_ID=MMETSP0015_2-20120614/32039_1 /TAXON_ID=2838 /ORGANISM="Odontella" /LENGTH=49 /DNA_ID=CAMNT_0000487359 /DNA_START=57 /DNA_END=203 /DNA_ORIENTATION=+ /assembly_acc=CAM_ASM_000160
MKGIRRPHFAIGSGSSMVSGASSGTNGTAVASSISSYVAYCRRERDLNK